MAFIFGAWLGIVLAMCGFGFTDPAYWALLIGGNIFFVYLDSK